jgi:hypothetical protein
MQAEKLYHYKEQKVYAGQAGVQEILPILSYPHSSQGNQVGGLEKHRNPCGCFLILAAVAQSVNGKKCEITGQ